MTQDKTYFSSLENGAAGESRPLAEVLSKLRFNEQGLVPCVTQDAESGEVLMLAWMNLEALETTLSSGQVTYYSRSRQELWIKGQTSGHTQRLVQMQIDCDGDAILCKAIQKGGACHTGRRNCFYLDVDVAGQTVHLNSSPGKN